MATVYLEKAGHAVYSGAAMKYPFFLRNDAVLPVEQAVVSLDNLEYAYGFGVYETVRITDGVPFFLAEHLDRLQESARAIELEHPFTNEAIGAGLAKLIAANAVETANLKILLIGGTTRETATLYAFCSNPLFPKRALYRDGAPVITVNLERVFPHAKTLNMLPSYLAYRAAKRAGAYDALLVNRSGAITEGTRTNLFCLDGRTLFSPPEEAILLGVTRKAVVQVARANGFRVKERVIQPADLPKFDAAFLTSTSTKILPICRVNGVPLKPLPETLRELMELFDDFLAGCGGRLG
jgi:branched-subunit amino acid aminotransferase/4-amino-4-deoxychorismate lyase